jgi:hypothetical protein
MNATWPFAQLKLTPDHLVLQVVLLGTYVFKPAQSTTVGPASVSHGTDSRRA